MTQAGGRGTVVPGTNPVLPIRLNPWELRVPLQSGDWLAVVLFSMSKLPAMIVFFKFTVPKLLIPPPSI
jgi:hypothetical protein